VDKISERIFGYALIRAVGAEPTRLLDRCAAERIEFWEAVPEDAVTLSFRVPLKEAESVAALAERCCCEAVTAERHGPRIWMKRLKKRPMLWILPAVLLAALVASSFFVWRIDVTGNEDVSETEIRNALEDCGVSIGSYWPAFNSDSIRNRVLVELPKLKWLSVSIFGSRAVVEVRERSEKPKIVDENAPVNVIAKEPGIIVKMSVLQGLRKVKKGQTAAKDDTLISGAMPSLVNGTRLVHAEGSVMARTWYDITAIMPLEYVKKTYTGREDTKFALIIGKDRINFYANGRIPYTDCDNIIEKRTLGIKGLFELPVTEVRERSAEYTLEKANVPENRASAALEAALGGELKYRIGADGEIRSSEYSFACVGGFAVGTLRAECLQDISEEKKMTESEINEARAPEEESKTQ